MMTSNNALDIKTLTKDLRGGSRAALARAITLIESRRGDHQAAARDLVQALLPDNPHLKLVHGARRGYVRVEVTPARLRADLQAMRSVTDRGFTD